MEPFVTRLFINRGISSRFWWYLRLFVIADKSSQFLWMKNILFGFLPWISCGDIIRELLNCNVTILYRSRTSKYRKMKLRTQTGMTKWNTENWSFGDLCGLLRRSPSLQGYTRYVTYYLLPLRTLFIPVL